MPTESVARHTRPSRKTLTAEHVEALVEGRRETAAIRRYLESLQATPSRRRRSPEQLTERMNEINTWLVDEPLKPIDRLHLIQERNDLAAELDEIEAEAELDLADLLEGFLQYAANYSARKGISHKAWREVGVPVEVLRKAGIPK